MKALSGNGNFAINRDDALYTFGNEIITLARNEKKQFNYFLGKQDTIKPYITDVQPINVDLLEIEFSEKINFLSSNSDKKSSEFNSNLISSIGLETGTKDSLSNEKNYLLHEYFKKSIDKFIYLTTDSLIESSNLYLNSNIFKDIYSNEVNINLITKNIILEDSIASDELKLVKVLPSKVIRDESISLEFNKIIPDSILFFLIEKNIDKKIINLTNKLSFEPFKYNLDFEKIDNLSYGKYKMLIKHGVKDTLYYKDFTVAKEKKGYGEISGKIISGKEKNNEEIVILFNQLDNDKKKYKIVQEISDTEYKVKVRPGKYLVASYIDSDKNGLFSVGKYWKMKDSFFSEKAAFVKDTVIVRKNWESSGFDLNFTK